MHIVHFRDSSNMVALFVVAGSPSALVSASAPAGPVRSDYEHEAALGDPLHIVNSANRTAVSSGPAVICSLIGP